MMLNVNELQRLDILLLWEPQRCQPIAIRTGTHRIQDTQERHAQTFVLNSDRAVRWKSSITPVMSNDAKGFL